MLKLDSYAESILFQCDRCRFVGELETEIFAEEGTFHCLSCLEEINRLENEPVKKPDPRITYGLKQYKSGSSLGVKSASPHLTITG